MAQPHPPELRARAIATAAQQGVTAAAKETGVSKGTISKWCTAAGVETVSSERNSKAMVQVRLDTQMRKANLVEKLLQIAELGTDATLKALGDASLRDVVGAWTRAIHDAQLLSGEATARTEHAEPIDVEIRRLVAQVKANG